MVAFRMSDAIVPWYIYGRGSPLARCRRGQHLLGLTASLTQINFPVSPTCIPLCNGLAYDVLLRDMLSSAESAFFSRSYVSSFKEKYLRQNAGSPAGLTARNAVERVLVVVRIDSIVLHPHGNSKPR